MFKGLGYSLKQAIVQIFRNKGMTVASLFAITAMLLILGLFFFLTVNVNFITEEIKDQSILITGDIGEVLKELKS